MEITSELTQTQPWLSNEPTRYSRSTATTASNNWLRLNLLYNSPSSPKKALVSLCEFSTVRILVAREDEEQLWVGVVEEHNDQGVFIRLAGSGRLLVLPLSRVIASGSMCPHSWFEFREICRRQRKGLPAMVLKKLTPALDDEPALEFQDDTMERIEEFAREKNLSVEDAVERLINVAIGRLQALKKYKARPKKAALVKTNEVESKATLPPLPPATPSPVLYGPCQARAGQIVSNC